MDQAPSRPSHATSPPTFLTTLKIFHLFPHLPPELQALIWSHAASQPYVFSFTLHRPINSFPTPNPMSHPLDQTCLESRFAMSRIRGPGYLFTLLSHPSRHPSFWLHYDPKFDTFFVSGLEVSFFTGGWGLSAGSRTLPDCGAAVIHSLAASGILEKAAYEICGNDHEWRPEGPWAVFFKDMTLFDAASYFMHFKGLAELIFVYPGLEEMCKKASSCPAGFETHKKVVTRVVEETRMNMETWMKGLERELKGVPEYAEVSEVRERCRDRHVEWSTWWANPKVILMTEDEFRVRFL